jgi:serine/threonine protein kinase
VEAATPWLLLTQGQARIYPRGVRDLGPGDRVGSYAVETVIGRGSMGVVFRARREGDDPVALKVLPSELADDEIFRARFERESRIARSVRHPHVVDVVDAGVEDGRSFLAMALVDGRSLAERLERDGALTPAEVVKLVAEIASALDVLHEGGLVHRDVKPANVMLDTRGTALLTDFGLARSAADTVLTQPGRVSGTADYLAPELILGGAPSASSDLYALGCTAYECLTRVPPFGARPVAELVVAHLQEEPPLLESPLAEAIGWALHKKPDERPPTASAFALMLRVSAAGLIEAA